MLGTLFGATALHIAISIFAPGDAGTMNALGDGVILFVIIFGVGLIGLVAFPFAAAVSWPFRSLIAEQPVLALILSVTIGTSAGGALTATEFQIGPGDFWSGPLVGCIFALVWFDVVRRSKTHTQLNQGTSND